MTINSWTENYGDDNYNGYKMSALNRDQCYMTVVNKHLEKLYLYEKYEDCLGCPYTYKSTINQATPDTQILNTKRPMRYRLLNEFVASSPENSMNHVVGDEYFKMEYGEFGIYHVNLTSENSYVVEEYKEPVSIYFPIITVTLIYAVIFSLIRLLVYLWDKAAEKKEERKEGKVRLRSLDTFRGISIVLMIFVNYGHGGYPILEHAIWNGLCIGDLVFPWFMWIMGVCIPMSIKSIKKNGISKSSAFVNITRRSIILFLLGLFLGAGPVLPTLRILGVLQRFAICYFVVASIMLFIEPQFDNDGGRIQNIFKDVLAIALHWCIMLLLLTGHTVLILFYQPPDCQSSKYLGPGGLHENELYKGCTGGVSGYVDRLLLGTHLYPHAEIVEVYKAQAFDPEGILGCLTSIFQVFLGVQAGTTLLIYKKHKGVLIRWISWGIISGVLGGALCGFSKEGGFIPVNKNLWSLSFVFVTSSLAFILLSLCYILIDVKQWWSGKPFLFAGMNAIIMYVGHNMTYTNFPLHWSTNAAGHQTHFTTLLENVQATSVWVVVAYVLYRKKFFYAL